MTWEDRLQEAAYNSPNGTRQVFQYEDVKRTVEKKTAAFNFPDANGTYIQEFGHSGRQFPLRAFFSGDNCDIEANSFEDLLIESGIGKLEHPIYGTVDVVPFGAITRRDELKTAANQAVVEVTFWETIGVVYPTGQGDPSAAVLNAVNEFNDASANELDGALVLDTAIEEVSFQNIYEDLLDSARAGLQAIADTQGAVKRTFDTVYASINEGIDTLIADPLTLAFQTSILIQAPARAEENITARLKAYRDLAESIILGENAVQEPGYDSRPSNKYHLQDAYAMGYVAGSVLSVINTQFDNKTEALASAEEILAQFEQVVAWRDLNYASLAELDTGTAYQQLQEAVALAAGFLVLISFNLKQERRVVLDRARTIVDLAAELYGSVDDQLDFLINTNQLTGSEILELPAGKEIVYYV